MIKKLQKGFTLVELMVALAVGALVVIGAGKLFIETLRIYDKVQEISRKQEAVVFMANTLARDYRSGTATYIMKKGSSGCKILNEDGKTVIDGLRVYSGKCDYFVSEAKAEADSTPGLEGTGYFTFRLIFPVGNDKMEKIEFSVMNRNKAVSP